MNTGPLYFDFDASANGDVGSAFNGTLFGTSSVSTVNSGYGLVTGFLTGAISVPEPGSLGLFGAILGLLALGGFCARMKRRQALPA